MYVHLDISYLYSYPLIKRILNLNVTGDSTGFGIGHINNYINIIMFQKLGQRTRTYIPIIGTD